MTQKRKDRTVWVPSILWQLFGSRARTLSDTILSLLSPSPTSFYIRPDDSSEYRRLFHHCFVVVSPDAPSLEASTILSRSTQPQTMRKIIEMLLCDQTMSANLLCSGYDGINHSSSIMELLTCSTWDLLLERVGDGVMVYLLKYTSIFLPHALRKFQQVSGMPISKSRYKVSNGMPQSQYSNPSTFQIGFMKKQKIYDGVSLLQDTENVSTFSGCVDFSNSSADNGVNQKKRKRLFSWQRRKMRLQINFQENKITESCIIDPLYKIAFARLQDGIKPCSVQQNDKEPSLCFYCSLLAAPAKLKNSEHYINRVSILYKLECSSSALPENHVLNYLKPCFTGASVLFREIFGFSDANLNPRSPSLNTGFHSVSSPCLYRSLIKTLKILIRRSMSCKYSRLFDKHCDVSALTQNIKPKTCSIVEGNDPTISYCSKSQVVSFIWAVCKSIVPPDLLGTDSNGRILRKNINKFIRLRRFEKFSLTQCMHKLKTSGFSLFSGDHSFCNKSNQNETSYIMKRSLLESWIFWFFSCLVVPLIQANFYVTEVEHGKLDLFYYRKSDWKRLTVRVISNLAGCSYRPLDKTSVAEILRNRSFGFSKLRLCPKEDNVRVIANLTSPSRFPPQKSILKCKSSQLRRKLVVHSKSDKGRNFKPVNSLLRSLHAVLKGIQMKNPDNLGASVFNFNDVYKVLCPFILGLKKELKDMPGVYVVVSDVAKAFDSIDQDKLLGVMKDLIVRDDYVLKQTHQVICIPKSLRVQESLILVDDISGVSSTTSKSPLSFSSSHCVLLNQGCNKYARRTGLYSDLVENLKHNVFKLHEKYFLQVAGIPQGSILSSLLCSFYYGHLERNVIYPFIEKTCRPNSEITLSHEASPNQSISEIEMFSVPPKYVLLRFVDDFMFISTSKSQASHFFNRLQRGFRGYNCYMNKHKSSLNFDSSQISGDHTNKVFVDEDGISYIRWCGLFINCSSLEVLADYTRYTNGHLSSTLTVSWQDGPARSLMEKLCLFMRPKCHTIFYDSNINSAAVVRLNIYQSFLVCAMKFHCYVRDLSCICKLRTKFYFASIGRSFRYIYRLIMKRMHPRTFGSGICPKLELTMGEVEWLGLCAYIRVLHRKQTRHKELLSLLRSKLLEHKVSRNVSSQLEYAVDESHSSLLWKIKY